MGIILKETDLVSHSYTRKHVIYEFASVIRKMNKKTY